ncbi:hypothetical protein ACIRU3_24130 [Streptomyces sp. NPDC101151]|uniref:hypothetical protein n=1 Tax=Streptomyces sp. NPDC101151 TaxID=3366115 RepID=UPI00382CA3E2
MRMNGRMFGLAGADLPSVRPDDVPDAYRAITEGGWTVDGNGAYLLSALEVGYHGSTSEKFEDIIHFEATVNGRAMMDYDLPVSAPERQNRLLRRSIAYACLALRASPVESAYEILGYVSLSGGAMSDDALTASVTFCTRRPGIPPYIGNIWDYSEESLLELSKDDAVRMLKDRGPS